MQTEIVEKKEELPKGSPEMDKPYKWETPIQKVVCAWKKITGNDPTDRGWDKAHWGRHARTAKQLIDFLGGHISAIECMDSVYEEMTKKGLSCTIETVLKHSAEWRARQEKNNVT